MDFWMRLGSSFGPGLLMVAIGGLVFAAISGREPVMEAAPNPNRSDADAKDTTAEKASNTDMRTADNPHPSERADQAQKAGAGSTPQTSGQAPRSQLP